MRRTTVLRVGLSLLGVAAMGYAAWLVLTGGPATAPLPIAVWLAGAIVLHDAVLAPVVLALGWLAARTLPPAVRGPVQAGAVVAGATTLMALPVLLGRGRTPSNDSLDPLDYSRNLLVVIVAIAVVTALLSLVCAARQRRRDTKIRPPAAQRSSRR